MKFSYWLTKHFIIILKIHMYASDNKRSINCSHLKRSNENKVPEVILRVPFFSKFVKSLHQKKCRCTLLTHFAKKISKCVMLVRNLTHFEKNYNVRWFGSKFNALRKKISECVIFSKCVATVTQELWQNYYLVE